MMKAAVINRFGPVEVLEIVTNHPVPAIAPNQVLVEVYAAGINPLDWRTRKGDLRFLMGARFPMILGNDLSGRVVQTGSAVSAFQEGDEVYGMMDAHPVRSRTGFAKSGAYAEFAVTRADTLARKPVSLSHIEAASIPLCALTAYQTLVRKARIGAGDAVLLNGASGGVGIFAVQIAKAYGAHVTSTCSGKNAGWVADMGADAVIDYTETDIPTVKERFDVIYDVVSSLSFREHKHLLKKNGLFVANVPSSSALFSSATYPLCRLFGATTRQICAWVTPSGQELNNISALINEGKLRTVIDRAYPLEQIRRAHEYSQGGHVRGKIVARIK